MLKVFGWTLFIVILLFICALFLTPDLTRGCSNTLIDCLHQKTHLPFFEKMGGGFVCVMRNVWCVLTEIF